MVKFRELEETRNAVKDLITFNKLYLPLAIQIQVVDNIQNVIGAGNNSAGGAANISTGTYGLVGPTGLGNRKSSLGLDLVPGGMGGGSIIDEEKLFTF